MVSVQLINTANIKFNRIVAKNNFKYANIEDIKNSIIKSLLSETGLIVTNSEKKAKEILNPNGTLEIQKNIAGEAIAFLSDETAVEAMLIQINAHGLFKFVYVLKIRTI